MRLAQGDQWLTMAATAAVCVLAVTPVWAEAHPPVSTPSLQRSTSAIPSSLPVVPTMRLPNGVKMPMIALGTPSCGFKSPEACSAGTAVEVENALLLGFTAIDTANHYNNQDGVAAGIKSAAAKGGPATPWITSKIEACNTSFVPLGNCYNATLSIARGNLATLGRTSLDLMLLHAPTSTSGDSRVYPIPPGLPSCNCSAPAACEAMQQQWAALEAMYASGELRAIGVSNYCPACFDCLAKTAKITPHVNQIMLHIGMGNDPSGLVSFCQSHGVVPQGYSVLGSGTASVLSAPAAEAAAVALGVSTAQVALRWLVQRGVPVIARTDPNQTAYMAEDLAIFNWTLSEAQMANLSSWAEPDPPNTVKNMCLF